MLMKCPLLKHCQLKWHHILRIWNISKQCAVTVATTTTTMATTTTTNTQPFLLSAVPARPCERGTHLLISQPVTEDVVHVLVQPLQAAVARPHIGVGGGHQALHCGLQAGQQLPVFPPEEGGGGGGGGE